MKINKLFLIYIATIFLLLITSKVFAEGEKDALWRKNSYERKVNTVGQRILQANEIKEMISFRVPPTTSSKSQVNAYVDTLNGIITVERPLLKIIENDDELAAILSHEIVHIINIYKTKNKVKEMLIKSVISPPCFVANTANVRKHNSHLKHFIKFLTSHMKEKYELNADVKAIDLMAKAGYNPIYMESIYQRMMADGTYLEFLRTHPKGSLRVKNIHQKIATEYPEFLEQKIEEVKNIQNQEKVENDANQENVFPVNKINHHRSHKNKNQNIN